MCLQNLFINATFCTHGGWLDYIEENTGDYVVYYSVAVEWNGLKLFDWVGSQKCAPCGCFRLNEVSESTQILW